MPVHFLRAFHRLALLVPVAAALAATGSQARCVDETLLETPPAATMPAPVPAATSRHLLQGLVQTAIRRSNSVGAARLLAEAAADDVGEARAGGLPQAALSTGVATLRSSGPNVTSVHGVQGRAGINVSAPLYDAGRIAELTGWRKNLAEAALLGHISAQGASANRPRSSSRRTTSRPTAACAARSSTRSTLMAHGKPLPVLPGMPGSVEVRTGERSVLGFLLRPMLKSREAFTEG